MMTTYPRLKALKIEDALAIAAAAEEAERERWGHECQLSGADDFDEFLAINVLPSERGLHQMVEILNLQALSELDAIMRIGRGDDHPRNFAELVAYSRKLRDGHRDAVYCILDKSYLGIGKQVRRGLELLGYGRSKPKPAEGA